MKIDPFEKYSVIELIITSSLPITTFERVLGSEKQEKIIKILIMMDNSHRL